MSTTVKSIISRGSSGLLVDIECHTSNSLPGIVIVGAGSRSVDEAKERVRGAFASAGLHMPQKRIIINLAPADFPKESSSLDLPIALAILKASGDVPLLPDQAGEAIFIGELGLNGRVRPVRGIIGKLLSGRSQGFRHFYIPHDNLQQAQLVPGVQLTPLAQLSDLLARPTGTPAGALAKTRQPARRMHQRQHSDPPADNSRPADVSLSDIAGQAQAKRALQIAAAGGHNILLSGPPGTGKSMLARALASLLPPMSYEEMLEVTHIHSLHGDEYDKLITRRPVRSPHHTASQASIIGGGNLARPGEISLAHRGVLLFDELPEFNRSTIEALRQPLEDRTVTITRAQSTATFPASFIFAATANPCPCGNYVPATTSDTQSILCDCPPAAIAQYQRKLSGPLLDRIDLVIYVDRVKHSQLLGDSTSITKKSDDITSIKQLVLEARSRQRQRYNSSEVLNAHLTNQQLKLHARLSSAAVELLNTAAPKLELSPRSYLRCIKVARTIADLADSPIISPLHVTEALHYRPIALPLP